MSDRFGLDIHDKPLSRLDRLRAGFRRGGAVSARRGHRPPPPQRTRVPLVRARYTLWIAVLAGAFITSRVYGTPHLLTTYTYWGPRDDPSTSTCNYWGLDSQTVSIDGACPLFRLLRAREARHG